MKNFEERLAHADALFEQGVEAYEQGNFQAVHDAFTACIDEFQILVDEGHTELRPSLARTRLNLAACLANLDELSLARNTYETTLSEYKSLIALGHEDLRPNLAHTRMNLAKCLHSLGELSLARTTYETSLTDHQRLIAQGREDLRPELAKTHRYLAICLQQLGDLSLARTNYETTLTEYESLIAQGRNDLQFDLAETRMNLASCLDFQGEFSLACTTYETALTEYNNLIEHGHDDLRPDLAGNRMNLANCLADLGELSLARTTYETTLTDYQSLIAQGQADLQPDLARTRMNLANCLAKLGELPLARTNYETTLTEYQSLIALDRDDLRPALALTRMNLANCLAELGELPLARTTYKTTLTEYESLIAQGREDLRSYLAGTRMNLGECLRKLGKLSLARTTFETTLTEYQSLIAQGHDDLRPELTRTRVNLANCLGQLDELSLARTTYETMLTDYQSLIAQGRVELRPNLTITRFNLAICLKNMKDFPASETHYQEAFNLLKSLHQLGQLFPDAIQIIGSIANWHRHPQRPPQPDKPEAFKLAKLGLDWLDELLNRLSDAATNFMLTKNLPLFRLATELALELNQPDQAYLILERSKSRVLIEQMLRERAEPGPQVDDNLRTQYQQLRQQLQQLANQLNLSASTDTGSDTRFFMPTRNVEQSPEATEQLWQQQQTIEQQLDKVRRAITEQDPAFGEAIQPQALSLAQVTALIAEHTLVIAFEQGPDGLRLYPITQQGVATPLSIDLSLKTVDQQAQTFQHNMRQYAIANNATKLRKTVTQIVQWLTTQLAEPLTQLTTQNQPQQLIFIPHVAWHLLPIHLVEIEGEALAMRYPVQYVPAMQILRLIADRPPAQQQNGCIIANPTQDLSGAEQESQTVYQLRGQIDKLLARQQAKLAAVRQVLNQSQHSHFSCHGRFATELTQAGLSMADGLLPALEIFTSIRMDNPRLVVMSACETAQMQPTLADEYVGLSSSFLFAGAHNVLATQWPVEDNASRLLMENFYQNIKEGLSLVNALRQAQAQLRNMDFEQLKKRSPHHPITRTYEHPYYWAGFVLIGDGE
jgi:CHAT domain-containing protein/Flp pilus assembly protein TadD